MLIFLSLLKENEERKMFVNTSFITNLGCNKKRSFSYHLYIVFCCCNFRVEYIQLALDHKPLNLGQGFPDFAAPEHVTKALADVATGDNVLIHQYTRGFVINCSNSKISKILT